MTSKQRGSQIQNKGDTLNILPTVQGSVEQALTKLSKIPGDRPVMVTLSSRTDTGVHALRAGAHFDLPPKENGQFFSAETIADCLNSNFKRNELNLRVVEACMVPDTFSARASVIDKEYLYRVCVLKEEFNNKLTRFSQPIVECNRTFNYGRSFDKERAEEGAKLFVGINDFGAFVGPSKIGNKSTICHIKAFTVNEAKPITPEIDPLSEYFDYYSFYCKGTRFLYHMVRKMVGVLLSLGSNTMSLEDVKLLFKKPHHLSWNIRATVVPGCGLYLLRTNFNPEHLIMTQKDDEKKEPFKDTSEVSNINSEISQTSD